MAMVITKAAAAFLTTVGAPAAFVNVAAPFIGNLVWTAAVTTGLNALAQSQVPRAEAGLITLRQSRPPRSVFMGAPSRFSAPYTGADHERR